MIIIRGSARVRPNARRDMIAACIAVTRATADDEGCVLYEFAVDLEDDAVIRSTEVWRDQAALDAHMEHGHTTGFLAVVGDYVEGSPTMEFTLASP